MDFQPGDKVTCRDVKGLGPGAFVQFGRVYTVTETFTFGGEPLLRLKGDVSAAAWNAERFALMERAELCAFKVGDNVVCIDDDAMRPNLQAGVVYRVVGAMVGYVRLDGLEALDFAEDRFAPALSLPAPSAPRCSKCGCIHQGADKRQCPAHPASAFIPPVPSYPLDEAVVDKLIALESASAARGVTLVAVGMKGVPEGQLFGRVRLFDPTLVAEDATRGPPAVGTHNVVGSLCTLPNCPEAHRPDDGHRDRLEQAVREAGRMVHESGIGIAKLSAPDNSLYVLEEDLLADDA